MGRRAKPAKVKVQAKRLLARKSPDNEGARGRDLEKRLAEALRREAEALERQTATAEILRVISTSPTNLEPVLDAVVKSATRFCGAPDASVFRLEGEALRADAHHGPVSQPPGFLVPVVRGSVAGRSVLERRAVGVTDLQGESEEFPEGSALARETGQRATLSVPLLREGVPIGVILLRRAEAVPFTDKQIALLQTFADQAVIAIENVRLFNETKEALAHQTATAEILRVISSSPTDVQPVFDAIARSATTLCEADLSGVYPFDGELIRFGAQHGRTLEETHAARQAFPQPPSRLSVTARAILARAAVQVADVSEDREVADSLRVYRTVLSVPMMRDERPAGAITVARRVVRAFSDKHIELLQTFADQAVIAIENVRLFKELQARNQELTVALAQQTATSEILAGISGAQTDVQPVFEAIVQNARRLCDASYSSVYRVDGQLVHLVAHNHQTPEAAEAIRGAWPMPLTGDSFVVRAIRENAVIHTDMQEDPTASAALFARGRALGHRRIVVVPMVREGQPIGAIRVSRGEATPFAERHIALLQTFADQAVIAIENVRLFKELEAANRELGAASQHKSEFLANMSHELRTPLNAIIGFSEVLTERMFGELNEKQAEYLTDIHASGQHLLSLINDILDLSKIEAGRMELELTDFDLPSAIDNALTLVRERAARRGITLDKSVDERLGQMRADERKVRQVVLNLLSNAIKFTPEGGRIEVRAVPADGSVEVSVSDTGIGIAPEDQEAVFEEFRQVGTADKKVEGTGLGLALSRKFVELHEGRIRVKSQVGVGSTFTFTLPLHPEK